MKFFKRKSSIKSDNGKNNRLILLDDNGFETKEQYLKNLEINFNGDNNTIKIYKSNNLAVKTKFNFTGNCFVSIAKTPYKLHFNVPSHFAVGSKLIIKENVSIFGATFIFHKEPDLKIEIGADCMLASGVEFRPTDSHTIFDYETKEILNKPKDIIVDDHVWIAKDALVLKGSVVPKNSVVASKSVFLSSSADSILDNSNPPLSPYGFIFAGVPARVVKKGINWAREDTFNYSKTLL